MSILDRRDFLKIAPAAAGIAAGALTAQAQSQQSSSPAIGSARYSPIRDYPIQPRRHWDVALSDSFWKPRVATNAAVTIPFQIGKSAGTARGLSGNVLEAAILSLKTHPDPKLQAQVDAAVQQLLQKPRAGNGGFRSCGGALSDDGAAGPAGCGGQDRRRSAPRSSGSRIRRSPAANATRSTASSSIA